MLTPEEWEKLEEMYKFWDEQTFAEMNLGYWPEEVKRVLYPAGFRKIIQMESYEPRQCSAYDRYRIYVATSLSRDAQATGGDLQPQL